MSLQTCPRSFEDLHEGATYEYGAYEVTKPAIIAFAQEFDPQPFHLDEAAGKASLLGGLATSGWHTAGIAMRLHVDHLLKGGFSMGSPGVAEMNWMKPVYAGDILKIRAVVLSARPSQSRPGLGIVELEYTMTNQHDERKMTKRAMLMAATKDLDRSKPITASPPPPANDSRMPEPRGIADAASLPDTNYMLSGYWDDIGLNDSYDMGTHTYLKDDIIRFARDFDPQDFHVDENAAKQGPFGALTASGWHTAAGCMRRLVLSRKPFFDEARKRGLPLTPKGPSPGFRDLKWIKPVYAGDTLRFTMTPIDKRKTSREGWGIVFTKIAGHNQRGEHAFEYVSASLWPVRP